MKASLNLAFLTVTNPEKALCYTLHLNYKPNSTCAFVVYTCAFVVYCLSVYNGLKPSLTVSLVCYADANTAFMKCCHAYNHALVRRSGK